MDKSIEKHIQLNTWLIFFSKQPFEDCHGFHKIKTRFNGLS
jgi:hypothetical protein